MIRNSLFKILIITLIVGLNWTGLSAVIETFAYFGDTETSFGNILQAGTLDFSLRSDQSDFVSGENMMPGASATRDIYIKKEGGLPFKYKAHSEFVAGSCDENLYNNLELKVWYNYYTATPTEPVMVLKYDGLLKDFDDFDTNPDDLDLRIPNDHPYFENVFYGPDEHWFYFQITLPTSITEDLQNMSCQFKFIFDGWQLEFSNPSGYSDSEEILNSVSTGNWMPKVTVVYPDGGEVWYLVPDSCPGIPWCSEWCENHGMNANCEYPVQWSATNLIGPDMDLLIDLYFSRDSGASWLSQFATNTENDGIFWWKIPYDSNYITSHGRIKAVATHKDYSFLTDWDMSDADFCPPMLTLEEIMYLEEAELLELAGLSENPVLEQAPEIVPEEEPGEEIVGDFQEETLSEEIEGTPEEIPPEEEITEESVNVTTNDSSPENAVTTEETIEENPSGEELPQEIIEETEEVIEESVIEEAPPEDTPAIEEEQVTIPDDNPGQEQNPEEGSGDGGESGENVSE